MLTFNTYVESFKAQKGMFGATDPSLPGGGFVDGVRLLAQAIRDPLTTFRRIYDTHGEVYVFNAVGNKLVMMLGPDAAEFVLQDRDRNFSARQGWNSTPVGLYFPNGLMLMDAPDHLKHRRIMQMAFTSDAMARHLEMMSPILETEIIALSSDGTGDVRMFDAIKNMTLKMAAQVFMGETLGKETDKLNKAFLDVVEASGIKNVLRLVPLPGTLGWTGLRARRILDKYFYGKIDAKRHEGGDDFFSLMCRAETPEGDRFSDDEVVDHLIFLMMAAHDTSTIATTNLVYHLGKDQTWQERCRAEALAIGTPHPSIQDLDGMSDTEMAIKEVLRLVPPLTYHARTAVRDLDFKGKRINKGNTVAVVPAVTHRLPDYWSHPDQFDPERFAAQRAEDKSHRCAWTPFGSGLHKCIGMHFGMMEVKTMIFHLLRNYEWSFPSDYEIEQDHTSLPKPKDRLPVALKPLTRNQRQSVGRTA